MERFCSICQAAIYEDEQTVCPACGAELPPAESGAPEEAKPALELDLSELEDDRDVYAPSIEETPDEPVPVEDISETPEEITQEEPAAGEEGDGWDLGIVGGDEETPPDEVAKAPPGEAAEEAEDEMIEVAEDEFICPNCSNVIKEDSDVCPHCSADAKFFKRCPTCAMGIDQVAEICPHCYTELAALGKEDVAALEAPVEEVPHEEEGAPAEEELLEETAAEEPVAAATDDIEALEEGQNGDLSDKEKKKMKKKLLKEQKKLEKDLAKGKITEEEFQIRLDEIRMGNGFGPIGGIVLQEDEPKEEKGPDLHQMEEGQNGKLPDKEKKKMVKKLRKEQRNLEKELEKGEITEEEFQQRLDEIRLGNGFGPIGGIVLDEAEAEEELEAAEGEEIEAIPATRREVRALKRERMREILAEERREGFFNYYNLSLITLFFFIFLAVFVFFEFIFMVGNITAQSTVPSVAFSLAPSLGDIIGVPILLFAVILTIIDAILHFWDRRLNLVLSVMIPTPIMIAGLSIDAWYSAQFITTDLLWIFLFLALMFVMLALDIACIILYPPILNAQDREELELYLEKEEEMNEVQQQLEEEYQSLIEEEEEKLRMKDEEMNDIQTKLDELKDQIQEEEEKLRLKEEEISAIKAELDVKTQELMEEEEKIRMKEEEMESLIQTELEKRAEDMMVEEEEKIRMKEDELIKAQNELEIQKNLFDDSREKLRLKEKEMMQLRTELENQMKLRMEEEDRLRLKEAAARMLERGKQKRVLFPFAAMVGQDKMKSSLVLNAIYPEIGGVLIRGQKGTGKSVSVRGLAEILPDIEVPGCKFNCDPAHPEEFCTECKAKQERGTFETHKRPVQVVDLPLNITEDRLVGSIDIEKILAEGVKSFEPGILAEAHRGILYVDEINLLDDYIVDILLDAASSGVVTIEREGISISHPSRFIIVGSMNPEEGELRPQILDRIALQSDVIGIKDVQQRIDIVKRREEFTADPESFREKFESSRSELREKIIKARELLPNVTTPPRIYTLIAQICLDFNVDGHRADIIIERAARANAAFEGRGEVTAEDIVAASAMALPHRMRRRPYEDEEFSEETLRKIIKDRETELEG